ncbi:ABC-type Fe3+/spermidine/putrescine transport system ATPase subunit [Rhizobium sp. BK529]|nr:ABC-type Fe3+/spermidine/putrescine transport system ATPase subunit [Rhizobium sp. BK529]TCS02961.1 TOBE domain-containing protein [Rhizobium sp. BK418]
MNCQERQDDHVAHARWSLAVSDEIIVMKDGEIAQKGAPRTRYDEPASAFIADFMGEANVVSCNVVDVDRCKATIKVEGLIHRLTGRNVRPGPAKLAVRPNAITLSPKNGGAFSGEVTHAAYLGDHVEYEVKTKNGTLFVVYPEVEKPLAMAAEVEIGFKDRGLAIVTS